MEVLQEYMIAALMWGAIHILLACLWRPYIVRNKYHPRIEKLFSIGAVVSLVVVLVYGGLASWYFWLAVSGRL